jgi:type IV pilus assembly protein PilO
MTVDFNIDDLKKLSPLKKALIVLVLCLVLGYLYYLYFLQDIINRQVQVRTKLTELETQISQKEKAAAQLERYKKEVAQLNVAFSTALLKLPNEREIGGLLASVVDAGRGAGVNFLLFEPSRPIPTAPPAASAPPPPRAGGKGSPAKANEPQKFYDEIPINVKIVGAYHDTVSFFAKVAQLSRIVNVENMTIAEAKPDKRKRMTVITSCTMKTYKFVDRGKK